MPDTLTQTDQNQTTEQTAPNSEALANALWNGTPVVAIEPAGTPAANAETNQQTTSEQTTTHQTEEFQTIDLDEYFKTNFGSDAASAKKEWEELRQLRNAPAPKAEEIQWANDESKKLFDLIKEGKRDEIRQVLNRQADLERLENYDVSDVNQASEIIKATLQLKHKDLTPQQIDRLYTRQYALPEKPAQTIDQTDEEYAQVVAGWQRQVQDKEQDIMIDARIAKPELSNFKSQIVLPDIQKANAEVPQSSQEDLAAFETFQKNFKEKLESDYQKFKGFNVVANDGDVQLPISYTITPEELAASKAELETLNPNEFLDQRWFDKDGIPNIQQMQEDLYLLKNRDKILQKIANESAAQRFLHHQKIQNNIKLNGVNQEMAPSNQPVASESQRVAESIWKL